MFYNFIVTYVKWCIPLRLTASSEAEDVCKLAGSPVDISMKVEMPRGVTRAMLDGGVGEVLVLRIVVCTYM